MAKPAHTSNQYDPSVVQNLLGKIDGFDSDLESERGTYMQKCRSIRERMSAVYDEAKAQGVPQKELRVLVKIRKHEKSSTKLYHELENDQQQNLKMLAATEKVMDLPLWRASVEHGTGTDDTGAMKVAKPMFEDEPQGIENAKFNKLN